MRKLFVLFLLFPSTILANSDNCYNATVRVDQRASGVVFKEDKENLWVLTAGHCIYRTKDEKRIRVNEPSVEFFVNGRKSEKYTGIVTSEWFEPRTTTDLAVIKVKKFQNSPKPIPISTENPKIGDEIMTVGCADSAWPSLVKGNIKKIWDEGFHFEPNPKIGRSGSGVFNKDGTAIIGIAIWNNSQEGGFGTAVHLSKIQKFLTIK